MYLSVTTLAELEVNEVMWCFTPSQPVWLYHGSDINETSTVDKRQQLYFFTHKEQAFLFCNMADEKQTEA